MEHVRHDQDLVLGVAPNARGFGFVVLEYPSMVLDWGAKRIGSKSEKRVERAIIGIFDRYQPAAVICRVPGSKAERTSYSDLVLRMVADIACNRDALLRMEDGRGIAGHFARHHGTRNKDDVARVVAGHFPELRRLLPKRRRLWMSEHPTMGIFDAAAVLSWYLNAHNDSP